MKIPFLFKCLLASALVWLLSFAKLHAQQNNTAHVIIQPVKNTLINGNIGYMAPNLANFSYPNSSPTIFPITHIVAMAVDSLFANDSIAVPLCSAIWTINPALGLRNAFISVRYQYACMLGWFPLNGLSNGNYLPPFSGSGGAGVLFTPASPNNYGNLLYWVAQ